MRRVARGVIPAVLTDLVAGVAPEPSKAALSELEAAGAELLATSNRKDG